MMQSYIDPETGKVVIGVPPPGVAAIPVGGAAPATPSASLFNPQPPAPPAAPARPSGFLAGPPGGQGELTMDEISVEAPKPAPAAPAAPGMLGSRIDPRTKQFVIGPSAPAPAPAAAPAPAPPRADAGGGMMRKPLGAYYDDLERERGLPTGYLGKIRAIESANGTNLVNPRSSARGDFQFLRGTAKQYGINPMDPYQSARAAADMAAANAAALRKRGIDPNGGNLYGTHQQGLSGFLKLHSGQRSGNAEMALNGGAGLSPSGFLAKWRSKYDAATPKNLGEGFVPPVAAASPGANRGQGPTVEAAQRGFLASGGEAAATAANPTPADVPAPVDNTYKGGLLGLAGVGNPAAPGMDKGFMGKLGDMASQPGGGALGGMAKALGALATPQTTNRPGLTIAPMVDGVNKPDASLLALLDPERRRRRQLGLA